MFAPKGWPSVSAGAATAAAGGSIISILSKVGKERSKLPYRYSASMFAPERTEKCQKSLFIHRAEKGIGDFHLFDIFIHHSSHHTLIHRRALHRLLLLYHTVFIEYDDERWIDTFKA